MVGQDRDWERWTADVVLFLDHARQCLPPYFEREVNRLKFRHDILKATEPPARPGKMLIAAEIHHTTGQIAVFRALGDVDLTFIGWLEDPGNYGDVAENFGEDLTHEEVTTWQILYWKDPDGYWMFEAVKTGPSKL